MSFVRFGVDGSDVYIITPASGAVECVGCILDHRQWFTSLDAVLAHLDEHRAAGHVVPEWAIQGLRDGWEEGEWR